MKRTFLFFLVLLCLSRSQAQQADGLLSSRDTAKLSIIRVAPDSFPHVRLLFKAEDRNRQPLWNITKEKVSVTENGQSCAIVTLQKVSQSTPIHFLLVLDHSGSMATDRRLSDWYAKLPLDSMTKDTLKTNIVYRVDPKNPEQLIADTLDHDSLMVTYEAPPPPDWYKPPIWYAKQAALDFLGSVNTLKDSFGIVGFSDRVHHYLPPTNREQAGRRMIEAMEANGSTAFYDALDKGLRALEGRSGIKVIVALTDGEDNSSSVSMRRVIRKAKDAGVPLYVIGLGDVNKPVLRKLARQTDGDFYYTTNPKKLRSIYLQISRRVQSIYELVYESPNLASVDTAREVQLQFQLDSFYLEAKNIRTSLPPEVQEKLREMEEQAAAAAAAPVPAAAPAAVSHDHDHSSAYIYGGLAVLVIAAGAGTLIARAQKRKNKQQDVLVITNCYPNPSTGPLTIDYTAPADASDLSLQVLDALGKPVHEETLRPGSGSQLVQLAHLDNGTYLVQLRAGATISPAQKVLLQK